MAISFIKGDTFENILAVPNKSVQGGSLVKIGTLELDNKSSRGQNFVEDLKDILAFLLISI